MWGLPGDLPCLRVLERVFMTDCRCCFCIVLDRVVLDRVVPGRVVPYRT